MAKKSNRKKTKKNSPSQDNGRILGIIIIGFSLFLFLAFLSYLFTWQTDQDKVLRFSWKLFAQNEESVDNLLGKLGALISHFFIYLGFGLASFLFVPIIMKIGIYKLKGLSIRPLLLFINKGILLICFLSIFLYFILPNSQFPFGGRFGSNVCNWLTDVVGIVGVALIMLLTFISWVVINFNFSVQKMASIPGFGDLRIPQFQFFKIKKSHSKSKKSEEDVNVGVELDDISDIDNEPSEEATFDHNPTENIVTDTREIKLDVAPEPYLKEEKKNIVRQSTPLSNAAPELEIETVQSANLQEVKLDVQQQNIEHTELFDPKKELSRYNHPSLDLLQNYDDQKTVIDRSELEANKVQIIETLQNYKIKIVSIRATIGPTVTLYEIVPAPGIKISKIKNLEDDIALSLAALGIRIIAPIPGKGTIGIEVPNKKPQIVSLKEVLKSNKFKTAKMDLPIALGKTIANEVFVADLAKMPHLLIAGATGQGKSVGINAILMSILYKKHPSQVKLVMIDPKKVELFPYTNIEKHFLAVLPGDDEPIVTETKKVIYTLNSLMAEMDERYELLKKARSRNIKEYNAKFINRKLNPNNGHKFLPFIVLVIDEFADLIMTAGKEIEMPIARLAQLSRAVGIHLIIATQRPSVNIITGIIKANFPARIAYKVTSRIDSRTILDQGGADQLIGRGDMLLSVGGNIIRLQCAFVDTPEIENVIDHISNEQSYPEPFHLPEVLEDNDKTIGKGKLKASDLDELFKDAAHLVVTNQHGSTSMIQRKLQLGYNRAGRIMDQLEALNIVGPAQGSKPREVYVFSESELHSIFETVFT